MGTAISISIIAQDSYSNTVPSFSNTVSLTSSQGSATPSTSSSFTSGVWTGTVTLSNAGSITLAVSDGNSHAGTSRTIDVVAAASPTPTPTATSTTVPTATPTPTTSPTPTSSTTSIPVTTDKGRTVTVTINNGSNITSSQISSAIITSNQTATTTTLSFNITGQSGTIGFGNMTISKNDILYGASPIVYIDGQQAQNQGFTQDSQNYYVWFTTHFSSHQVQVHFTGQMNLNSAPISNGSVSTVVLIAIIIAFIAVIIAVTITFVGKKRVKNPFYYVEK